MGFNVNVLKMDKFGNVKPFTFILSTKNYKHLGKLNNIKTDTIDFKSNLNGANELSFELYKKIENEVEKLWNDITDLKSIYVPELNEYFEIQVAYNDKLEETKTIICKSLCESELSQTYIHGTEINTQTDSDRLDYTQTIFYDGLNPKGSLLHRVLSFVPQYRIKHVDDSLCKLQRSFSIDGTTVYDFLTGECAEQFNCLFVFDSTDRSISAYDLYTSCNECGHRDAYSFVCPECGSTNINYFGNDTDIYIDKKNFSDDIKLEVDVDSIKNCLRLRSGDDIMDEAIISMNPNGTRYIYYISDEQREDMSGELVNKIDEYDKLVEQYTPEYQDLALDIRELTDRKTYYESTMIPSPIDDDEEIPSDSISSKELAKLTQEKLSPVGMDELSTAITLDTVDIVVKNYAKVFVNSSLVKIDIVEGSTFTYKGKDKDDWDYGIWTGKIKLVAYSDTNDLAITDTLTLTIHDNYGEFLQQKVMKEMALNDKEGSVFNVLDIEDFDEFKLALKEYCLSRLRSFHMALDTACITLVSLDQATENADWYEDIYVPYHNKLLACSDEILVRESQIKEIQDQLDILYARKSEIQSILNFEDYLGNELYIEFCTYKREGEYQNDNYISDGLSNAEIIDRAKEFIEVAKKELIRSATKKYTISTNLHNLLLMKEFKPLANKFALGNFIRVRVGKDLFRLRLNSYHLTFSDLSTIDVEFSDMTKSINVIDATQKILSDAQSMASNISYISKQAEKGEKANESVNNIVQNGLDSALTQIKNNVNQEFVIDNNGILGRRYNDITGKYSPEQIRITNNIIALTENNWVDTTCALGKHKYTYYDVDSKTFKQSIGFGLSSKFSQNSFIYGSQIIGGDIFSENYSPADNKGTHINLNDGSFNFGHKIIYDAPTDKMIMKGVTIEWDSTTNPSIDNVNGLNEKLSDIDNSITSLDETFANELTNYVTNSVFNGSVADLQSQIDGSITTWFEDGVPSLSTYPTSEWITTDDKNKHLGDLYYDNLTGYAYRFQLSDSIYEWIKITDTDVTKALSDAKYAQDTADGKRRVFVTTPVPPYDVGDLWVQGTNGDIMRCAVAKTDSETYVVSDWIKASKYTDDTKADEAYTLADNAKGVADNAKTIGEALVNGLGFKETEITGEYIISPVIAGGTLLIGDKSGTYAQITETGILNCVGANIRGTVYATDGEFTGKITASDGSITGNLQIGGSLYSEKDNYRVTLRGVQSAPEYGVFFIEDLNGDGNGNRLFPFRLNGDGSFAATKANIEGKITAIDGEIGGINISSTGLYYSGETSTDGFGLWRNGCHPHNNSYIIMHAGANGSNISTAKFRLYQDGSLYTSNLNVTGGSITGGSINIGSGNFEVKTSGEVVVKSGTITLGDATLSSTGLTISGTKSSKLGCVSVDGNSLFIGSWNYGNSDVSKNSTPSVFMCDGSDYEYPLAGVTKSGWAFGAGKNFGVTIDGELYCSAGQIGNWKIASNGALIGKAQTDTSPYTLELYPSGIDIKGNTFYILICKDDGNTPVAGMTISGWVSSI